MHKETERIEDIQDFVIGGMWEVGRSKVGGGAALTLAVKDEAEGITVVLCSESDGVIVTSTSHNLLHPGIRGRV